MDPKALYNLSYGIYLLGANFNGKKNACIIDTCMQVASDPIRIAISVMNSNFTCEMIKNSKSFSLSVLDTRITFEDIKHFGFQSGRNVNKFENESFKTDSFGNPYKQEYSCSLISAKVLSSQDLGTHTLFIAEIIDAQILSNSQPVTYDYYQKSIKPKSSSFIKSEKIIGWRCKICGFEYIGSELPENFICPVCGHPKEDFEPIYGI